MNKRAMEMGLSEDFLRNYSTDSVQDDSKHSVPHIWAILNYEKINRCINKLMQSVPGLTRKMIMGGSFTATPIISSCRNPINTSAYKEKETGAIKTAIYVNYVVGQRETTKMYMHNRDTPVSLFEYMMCNDPADFQIDTSGLFTADKRQQETTLKCIKDMATASGMSYSYLSLLKGNIDIAQQIRSYKDMHLIPRSDITINIKRQNMVGEDDGSETIIIPLSDYFTSLDIAVTDMRREYDKLKGADSFSPKKYVDNVIVFSGA